MNESVDGSNTSNVSSSTSNSSHLDMGNGSAQESSIGSAGSLAMRNHISNTAKHANQDSTAENDYATVSIFLTTLGLHELIPVFKRERIDANVLNYLEDEDLKAGICQYPSVHARK